MKNLVILFAMCFVLQQSVAQNKVTEPVKTIGKVEVTPPQFTGIENVNALAENNKMFSIENYITKNARYPEKSLKCYNEGTEVVQFTVNEKGAVTDIKIVNSLCPEIDDEITRLIKSTNGMWKPGMNNNESVAMTKEISIIFRIADNASFYSSNRLFREKGRRLYLAGNKNLFQKKNAKKALKLYNEGIRYMPYDQGMLIARGLCKFELGDEVGAFDDWNRVVSFGGINMEVLSLHSKELKGYEEFAKLALAH